MRGIRLTTEEFIKRAKEVHGDKYDYSTTTYTHTKVKVRIVCPTHGEFWSPPHNHLRGNGCKRCAIESHAALACNTTEWFVEESKKVHGEKYDYSLTHYLKGNEKVKIICREHGVFHQVPKNHLVGQGCPLCALPIKKNNRRDSAESFVLKAKEKHGDKYDYSFVDYLNQKGKVRIICREHGEFLQAAGRHLLGAGCPLCASFGFKQGLIGHVYILESADYFKVGITNKPVDTRVHQINKTAPQPFTSVYYKEMSGRVCNEVENKLLKWLRSFLQNPPTRFDGFFESFCKNIPITQVIDKLLEFEQEVISEHN